VPSGAAGPPGDRFDLARFVEAQAAVIEQVRRELRGGRKRTHWMWYVFPQLRGLGHSAMAQRYGLRGSDEAAVYLAHPLLGARLVECTQLVNQIAASSIEQIFSAPDDLKFRSCMTLFASLQGAPPAFSEALAKYFGAVPDSLTIAALQGTERPAGAGRPHSRPS
jgi:uncharacterized protein (DUF1810 family)